MPISVCSKHAHSQPPDETVINLRDLHTPSPQQQCRRKMLFKAFRVCLCKRENELLRSVCDSFRLFADGEERAPLTSITSSSPCLWPPPPEWRNYSTKRSLPQGQRHKLSIHTCLIYSKNYSLPTKYAALCFLIAVGEKWTFLQNQYLKRMMQWRYGHAVGHPTVILGYFKPVSCLAIDDDAPKCFFGRQLSRF